MKILPSETRCIVIDLQEKLVPAMAGREHMVKKSVILLKGLRELDIPITLTTQYEKGLGATIPEIADALGSKESNGKASNGKASISKTSISKTSIDKKTFSAYGHPQVRELLNQDKVRKNIIILGIETHICVLQTIIDLSEAGYRPVLIEDCTSSKDLHDKEIGVERAVQEGAVITTMEAALFELAQSAGNPHFRQISALIKSKRLSW